MWRGGEFYLFICFSIFHCLVCLWRHITFLSQCEDLLFFFAKTYLVVQHAHSITAMWQSRAEAARAPGCSHSLYISSLPGFLLETAKYGDSSGIVHPVDVSTVHVHLTPGSTRCVMEAIAWCKSQLLILKPYEVSALNRLLGSFVSLQNTHLTAGSLGSHGRTHSAPWLCHICCWMMSKCVPCTTSQERGMGACPHEGNISKYIHEVVLTSLKERGLLFPGL